ncbi:MAG: hypothetical protein AABX60_03085 [Nanoarchaeota archaeon]
MMDSKPDGLENVVKDAYIVYVRRESIAADAEKAEAKLQLQQRFEALLVMAEQFRQQYGAEKFSYQKFEFVPAIAAVIKEQGIIGLLQSEGYAVKEQGRMYGEPPQQP